jgi:hypothetical protein
MPVLDLNSPKFNEYYLKQFEGAIDETTFHE